MAFKNVYQTYKYVIQIQSKGQEKKKETENAW